MNRQAPEQAYRHKVEGAIRALNLLIDPNEVPLIQTSSKFQELTGVLEGYSQLDNHTNFRGIIFVEERMHAHLLHRLISRCATLKGFITSDSLTGHASGGLSGGCEKGMTSNAVSTDTVVPRQQIAPVLWT